MLTSGATHCDGCVSLVFSQVSGKNRLQSRDVVGNEFFSAFLREHVVADCLIFTGEWAEGLLPERVWQKARISNLIEVLLLHRQLARHNQYLEQLVRERTAELRESEARYRALTELATDWYWEQDGEGHFTKVSGPVLEMLGLQVDTLNDGAGTEHSDDGWNLAEREALRARIAARRPFLDMVLSRVMPGGVVRQYRVSGTPMFDASCTLIGYRGFGVEVLGSSLR
mgnify:CR=1 FL=1